MESFRTAKEAISRAYTQPTGGETSSTSYMSDKGLISRTHKGLQTLDIMEIKLPITKWANELNRVFKNKEMQMANNCFYKHSISLSHQGHAS